jgi:hypothetical protein
MGRNNKEISSYLKILKTMNFSKIKKSTSARY